MKLEYLHNKLKALNSNCKEVFLKIDGVYSTLGMWFGVDKPEISIYFDKVYSVDYNYVKNTCEQCKDYTVVEFRKKEYKPGFVEINPDDVEIDAYEEEFSYYKYFSPGNLKEYLNGTKPYKIRKVTEKAVVIEIIRRRGHSV